MKVLHHGAWLILSVILQATLLSAIAIFGISPNIFLVSVVLIGFLCGRYQGMICGMVFGFCYDILVGRFIGVSMLEFMLIGYFSAVFSDKYYKEPPMYVLSVIVLCASCIAGIFCFFINTLFYDAGLIYSCFRIVLPESVYSALLTFPIGYLMKKTLSLCGMNKI